MLAEAFVIRLPRPVWSCTFLGHKETRAVSRLRRRIGDVTAARDALARWQRRAALHVAHQHVESALCVRLNELELREDVLVGLDMVAVLHLVEAIGGSAVVPIVILAIALFFRGGFDLAGVRPRVVLDRQQRVHRPGYGNERTADLAGVGGS